MTERMCGGGRLNGISQWARDWARVIVAQRGRSCNAIGGRGYSAQSSERALLTPFGHALSSPKMGKERAEEKVSKNRKVTIIQHRSGCAQYTGQTAARHSTGAGLPLTKVNYARRKGHRKGEGVLRVQCRWTIGGRQPAVDKCGGQITNPIGSTFVIRPPSAVCP